MAYAKKSLAEPASDAVEVGNLKPHDDVPQKLRNWYRMDRDKAQDWRDDAAEDFDFAAARQYSADELKVLKDKRRPNITFDRIGPIVAAVTGYEIGNRREVRYIPREEGDVLANETLTSAGQWFNDEAKGDYVRSAVFSDCYVCGMGWSETRIDYTERPDGQPREDHIDPFEMVWDRDARGRNLGDMTRVWRARRVPLEEAQAMFPGFTKAELNATWSNVNSELDLKRKEAVVSTGGPQNYVTIVQCQYITRETHYLAEDTLGDPNEETGEYPQSHFTEDEYNTANKRLKQLGMSEMDGVRFRKKVIKQAFLGNVVLSYGDAPCPDEFSFQCVTGKYDRNRGTWFGGVRTLKDPQRWANKWLAQMMFIMNSNAKGGLFAEKRAFANPRQAEQTYAQPDAITLVEDGGLAAIKEKAMAPFPAGFQQLTEFAISSIRDVAGVSLELLGTRENDQPASLEAQRKQAGLNMLQWAFDGMKLYSEKQGRVVLYYLQNDLSDGRLIRIVGKDQEKYVKLTKQADLEYDIIVDDAPTSPNQKEQIWAVISSFMPLVGKVIPPEYILKALKYSPLPATVVAELEKMASTPDPMKQQAAATAARQAAADVDKTNSEAMLNQAKAQQAGMPANAQDTNVEAAMQWRETLFNGLIKLEVAKITAKSQNDSDELDAQIESLLSLSGMASDHVMQMRQMAHERAMARMQNANAIQQQQVQQAGQSQLADQQASNQSQLQAEAADQAQQQPQAA
jgi:hypothetical protein